MILTFKATTSKAKETFGWNVITLTADNKRVAREVGGGYDMFGSALGAWMEAEFETQLKKLHSNKFYGVFFWNTKTRKRQATWTGDHVRMSVDGGCGWESMLNILHHFNVRLQKVQKPRKTSNETSYIVTNIETMKFAA